MNQQIASTTSGNNGESTPHDLFALTDEQILEIEPEAQDVELSNAPPPGRTQESSQVAPASLQAGSNPTAQNEKRPHPNLIEIRRAHVLTPVTLESRMPSSALKKKKNK